MFAYQHRDTGAVYRIKNNKVDRLSWSGESWIPSAYKPENLRSWPFETIKSYCGPNPATLEAAQ